MRADSRPTPRRRQQMPMVRSRTWRQFRTSRPEQPHRTPSEPRRTRLPPMPRARATARTHCVVARNRRLHRLHRPALLRRRRPRRRAIHRQRRLRRPIIRPLLPIILHPRQVRRRHPRRLSPQRLLPLLARSRRYQPAPALRARSRLLPMPHWASGPRPRRRSIRRFRNSSRSPSLRAIRKLPAMPALPLVRLLR